MAPRRDRHGASGRRSIASLPFHATRTVARPRKWQKIEVPCDESVLPIKNKLWVYGCLKPDTPENDTLRLVGTAEGYQPIVAVSHEGLKHWIRYALISHVSAMIGFVIFIVVTAFVLR